MVAYKSFDCSSDALPLSYRRLVEVKTIKLGYQSLFFYSFVGLNNFAETVLTLASGCRNGRLTNYISRKLNVII